MSLRSGSADRLVLPVPDSPKNRAVSPCLPCVGGAVHGQHFLLGQVVIEDGEDRFLDLAGIGGAADEDQLLAEVDHDEGFGIGAVQLRHGVEARGAR